MKKISIIFTALLFTGCGVKYTPPVSGSIANIQFKNDSQRNLSLAFYKNSTNCVGRQKVQTILPNTEKEIVTYAGKELTFQYFLTTPDSGKRREIVTYCLMNLRFSPEPNNSYIFSTSEDAYSCKWKMFNITNKEEPIEIKLKAIPWKSGFSESSSFCKG